MRQHSEGHFGKGMRYTGPSGYKPKRDKSVNCRTVPCPDCKAEVGEWCTSTVTGKVQRNPHRARRRMAIRLENEMRNEVDL